MAPLDTGRYIITNCKHRNVAFLPDNNDRSGVVASNREDDSGEMWNVDRLNNNTYKIQNYGHSSFATAESGFWAKDGDYIIGGIYPQQWKIMEMGTKGDYCITTRNMDICWTLADGESQSPIVLGNPPNARQSQWNFIRVEDIPAMGAPVSPPAKQAELPPPPVYRSAPLQDEAKLGEEKLRLEIEVRQLVEAKRLADFEMTKMEEAKRQAESETQRRGDEARRILEEAKRRAEKQRVASEAAKTASRHITNVPSVQTPSDNTTTRDENSHNKSVQTSNNSAAFIDTPRTAAKGLPQAAVASPDVTPIEDALSQLVSTSESDIGLDSIVKGAEESLKFIEPWSLASSGHPAVSKIIQDVRKQSQVYCKAIDMSVQTADDGCAFSTEAIDLCDFLLSEDNTAEDLVDFISEMRETAVAAHRAATETSEKFRSVRTGLFEIARDMPGQVAKLLAEEAAAKAAEEAAAEAAAEAARKKTSFFGRWFTWDSKGTKESTETAPEPRDFKAATAELEHATTGLMKLTNSVDVFAKWWLSMDTALSTVEHSAASLQSRPGNALTLKVNKIRKRWEAIHDDYQSYKIQITRLRDIYQSQLTKAPPSALTAVVE